MNILSLTKEATIYRLPFLITNYQIAKRRQCSQAILSKEKHIERICLLLLCLSVSFVWLFVTPWAAAHQASLSFAIFQSLLRLMSTESVMPSNHLILCHHFSSCPQSFPVSESFPMKCGYPWNPGQYVQLVLPRASLRKGVVQNQDTNYW